ncbi:MAG: glycosyltransferase [Bacteroidia bacterium]|nr:glycosyltransferase [Bacteroidia bacterium]
MLKRIIISVTSDLVTDQRVHRAAATLKEAGFRVLVIGRRLPDSRELPGKKYRCRRFRLWFHKGPLFYANFNIRLFFTLMFESFDLLLSNDLDSLPANYLASKLKGRPLVYDSHEYFTEVPELVHRPKVQRFWKKIESMIVPKLKYAYTVNESIAELFRKEYNVEFKSIRNVPEPHRLPLRDKVILRRELGLPVEKHIVILQGAGINIQRGAEEAVMAMQFMENTLLLIVGGGDVIQQLKNMVKENGLSDKVRFEGKKNPNELVLYTHSADLGLSLDKDTNLNYRFSLPNKLFDYIQAGIPVLASDLPEIKRIVERYEIGRICPDHDPVSLAKLMQEMLEDQQQREQWKHQLSIAAEELNWDKEKKKFIEIFRNIEY